MGKLALIANVGPKDHFDIINTAAYLKVAQLPLFKYSDVRDVSTHEFMQALKRLRLEPTEKIIDLLVIASTMYAADTRIERRKFASDSWTRMIDLYIPVDDPNFWQSQTDLLQRIFRFLTGDIWTISFRERADSDLQLSPRGKLKRYGMQYHTDTVCLFSGGLDSFVGAINLLEDGIRPLLVSHAKSSDVTLYQEECYDAIKAHYVDNLPERIYGFIRVPKDDLFGDKDDNERGRSFLFLTLGMICASALGPATKLIIPENGMISLNIPLTPLRAGSHSTRTTHPYYLRMMQELFANMESGVQIENPFQFKTKGEMLRECTNQQLVIDTETMSCSHPSGRWEGRGNGHCGYCVPCLIRQAAFKAAGLVEKFGYRNNIFNGQGLDITTMKGADVVAFKYMIEKVRVKPSFLTAAVRTTGPLGLDIAEYVDVYRRALDEVGALIKSVQLV